MPRVGHPWRKHFCDARFIVMEVDTSVMIILVMSWNTSTTAQVWLSWFCHKFVMDVHAWQKTRPTVTNTYHHGSVFFCSDVPPGESLPLSIFYIFWKRLPWSFRTFGAVQNRSLIFAPFPAQNPSCRHSPSLCKPCKIRENRHKYCDIMCNNSP